MKLKDAVMPSARGASQKCRIIVALAFAIAGVFSLSCFAQSCDPPAAGLVSWWPLNGTAVDLVGGNNGTLVGSVTTVTGEVGQAYSFSGSGEGVKVGNPANLQLQTFSIDAWVKRSSTTQASLSSGGGLLFSYGSGGYGFGMQNNGQILLSQIDSSQVASSLVITDTAWHHVAVTKNGSTVVFYVDGVADTPLTYNPSFVFTSSAAIGEPGDRSANCFLGSIDEVDVFNRALAATEIQAIYNAGSAGKCTTAPPVIISQPTAQTVVAGQTANFVVVAAGSGTLSYQWRLNSANISGATTSALTLINAQSVNAGNYTVIVTNAYGSITSSIAALTVNPPVCDAAPTGLVSWWTGEGNTADQESAYNGTIVGSVTYVTGEVGEAFNFNGNGAAVNVGNPAGLQLQSFTIDAWVQRGSISKASLSTGGGMVFSYGTGGYGFALEDNGQLLLSQINFSQVASTAAITDMNWHHVAVTKSAGTVVFYLDGVAYPAAAYNPTFTFTTSAAVGGRGDNAANSFLGSLDEVDVFNRALTTAEVQGIYNATSAGKCSAAPPSISTQPASETVTVGNTASISAVVIGTAPLSYQWQFNNANLAGATSSALNIANVQLANAGTYKLIVTVLLQTE